MIGIRAGSPWILDASEGEGEDGDMDAPLNDQSEVDMVMRQAG